VSITVEVCRKEAARKARYLNQLGVTEMDRDVHCRTGHGGRSEIRTHGGLAPTAVFKTAALNHSAILPSP
jgi:hypothetical protein